MEGPTSSSAAISTIPGEPAILINGIPKLPPQSRRSVAPSDSAKAEAQGIACLGDWMEGREVQKLFGDKYFIGTVTQFDKEAGWYRVIYEDGDFEDLEWHELHEILVPLDITIPLKSLALNVISKGLKPEVKEPPKELKEPPKELKEPSKELNEPSKELKEPPKELKEPPEEPEEVKEKLKESKKRGRPRGSGRKGKIPTEPLCLCTRLCTMQYTCLFISTSFLW